MDGIRHAPGHGRRLRLMRMLLLACFAIREVGAPIFWMDVGLNSRRYSPSSSSDIGQQNNRTSTPKRIALFPSSSGSTRTTPQGLENAAVLRQLGFAHVAQSGFPLPAPPLKKKRSFPPPPPPLPPPSPLGPGWPAPLGLRPRLCARRVVGGRLGLPSLCPPSPSGCSPLRLGRFGQSELQPEGLGLEMVGGRPP